MEPFEARGTWWLPELPDQAIPGWLTCDTEGESTLRLVGTLGDALEHGVRSRTPSGGTKVTMTREAVSRSGIYPRIVGRTTDAYYTLEDCFMTHRNPALFGGQPTEDIAVNQVFKGVGLDPGEALEFDRVTVAPRWLTHWIAESALEESMTREPLPRGKRGFALSISATGAPPRRCLVRKGTTVTLSHRLGISGDQVTARSLTQTYEFSVRSRRMAPVAALLDLVADLQSVVSMGTGRIAEHETLSLFRPDVAWPRPNRRPERRSIELIARWNARDVSGKTALSAHQMPFTFYDLGATAGLGRWLRVVDQHRDALRRVMATRYSPTMYLSDRILNRAAALEAFDRQRRGGNQSFRTRMLQCAALAGQPFNDLVHNVEKWAAAFRDDRNDAAHALGGSLASNEHAFYLAESGYWLFVLCLLREARAPRAAFEHIRRSPDFTWLAARLRGVLT